MMTYAHWMSQTKRGPLTPRSKKLVAIDDAFKAFELASKSSGGTAKSVPLFNALIDWIAAKGSDWKQSTRNSKRESGGKGTIETLLNDLLTYNPAFRMQAAQYLGQNGPPPPALLKLGAKMPYTDVDGGKYTIPIQTEENSCGPCSVRLVLKLVNNEDVGEDALRAAVEFAEEGGAYTGTLGQGGVVGASGHHDWSPSGKGTWFVPTVLKGSGVECKQGTDLDAIFQSTKKKPAIAVVAWNGGGLHYVVVVGKTKANDKFIVLDPFYGLQYVGFSGSTLSDYKPVDANGKQVATGSWHSWVCSVA
ncbi:MAG TPA: hypothetical protein VMI54_21565 [Polyangiaceae bacterium]|nr:hypothetical protein [Polyangiaceae bacterium]